MNNLTYIHGMNPVFEVLRAGKRPVHRLWINQTQKTSARTKRLLGVAERMGVPVSWTDKGELYQLCQSKEHQGVVAESNPYPYLRLADLWATDPLPRHILLLDNIEDPRNAGAILRSAEVFGFHTVCLPMRGVPEVYASVVKSSAGATEYLNLVREASANKYVNLAIDRGYRVVALDAKGKDRLADLNLGGEEDKILLAIGGEDRSVGQYILNKADHVVGIAQQGQVNSLNASVAAGIAMHALASAATP